MTEILSTILQRRATKIFEPLEIPPATREEIMRAATLAPSSFNIQPYRFYWVDSPARKQEAARLCMSQKPAKTASALVVAVADIGSWQSTTDGYLEFIRSIGAKERGAIEHAATEHPTEHAPAEYKMTAGKIADSERRAKLAKWFFIQGWFNLIGGLKWALCRAIGLWRIWGMPPVSRQGLFKWATKNTALACENLMIAAEALGWNTCPMEGFDGLRLAKFLSLSPRYHEIVMVIAVGKRSARNSDPPQWRRPLEATVTVL